MDGKKLYSAMKKADDDETQSDMAGIIRKRRISFSGRKCVRVFHGEEEPKAWKDSYEESDRSSNSEVPISGVTTTDAKSFTFDASNITDTTKSLGATMDFINATCHNTLNLYDCLQITLTEKEKLMLMPKKQLQPYESSALKNMELAVSDDKENFSTEPVMNKAKDANSDINQFQINEQQTVCHAQDMDITLGPNKENIPLTSLNIDTNAIWLDNENNTIPKSCLNKLEDSSMDITLQIKDSPPKQLQKTMYYDSNIDGLTKDKTLPPNMHMRKTILFNANDIQSDVNIDRSVECLDTEDPQTKGTKIQLGNDTDFVSKPSNKDNDDVVASTKETVVVPTNTKDESAKKLVVRRITLKPTPAKDIPDSNNKRYAKQMKNTLLENEFKNTHLSTKVSNHEKTEALNLSCDSTPDPFAHIFSDSNDSILGTAQSNKIQVAISKDSDRIQYNSMSSFMDIERLQESASEKRSDKRCFNINTYKNKLPRYSQADELLLDNTSYLTKAKVGDETASRNSTKCTPGSLSRVNEIDNHKNSTGQATQLTFETSKPNFCKSLNFSKMSESNKSASKNNMKDLEKLETTEDFAQPLTQIGHCANNDNNDESCMQLDSPLSEMRKTLLENINEAESLVSALQSKSGNVKERRTMLLSEDIQPEKVDRENDANLPSKPSNKPSLKAKRQTLLMCEDIELIQDENAGEFKKQSKSHSEKNVCKPQATPARRHTVFLQEDMQSAEIENELKVMEPQKGHHAKQYLNMNERNKKLTSVMCNNIHLDESVALAEKEIATQIQRSIFDQQRKTISFNGTNYNSVQNIVATESNKVPNILKRHTIYNHEDMHLATAHDEEFPNGRQSIPTGSGNKSTQVFDISNFDDIECIKDRNIPKRHTIYKPEDMQLDIVDKEHYTNVIQPNCTVTGNKSWISCNNHFDEDESIKDLYMPNRHTIHNREDMLLERHNDEECKNVRQPIYSVTGNKSIQSSSTKHFDKLEDIKNRNQSKRHTIYGREDMQLEKDNDKECNNVRQPIYSVTGNKTIQSSCNKHFDEVEDNNRNKPTRCTIYNREDMQLDRDINKEWTNISQPIDIVAENKSPQSSCVKPFDDLEHIKNQNKPNRHTIYKREDMQLERGNDEDYNNVRHPNCTVTDSKSTQASCTIHFIDESNILMDKLENVMYNRTPSKSVLRVATTPKHIFERTPQRSFLEFINNERQAEMEMQLEENEDGRQTTCQLADVNDSYSQCNNTGAIKKRLALHLTPNMSIAKKHQTYIFNDCGLDESRTSEVEHLRSSVHPKNNTVLQRHFKNITVDVDDMDVSSATQLNNLSVQMELETQNHELAALVNVPIEKPLHCFENNCTTDKLNASHDNVQPTPAKSTISRIPIPVGSAKKKTPNKLQNECSPQANESDVYIIDDDPEELDTIPNPRKAFTLVQRRSTTLPEIPRFSGKNQSINNVDQPENRQSIINDISRQYRSLNIMEFDDIDKTNISLIGTLLDTADTEIVEYNITKVEETVHVVEEEVDCNNYNLNTTATNGTLCRKCKRCQDTILNDTSMVSFVLPSVPVIPVAGLEALRKIRNRPKLIDVHNYYNRLSLEREMSCRHEDESIMLGASIHEPEDEVDILIANYRKEMEIMKKEIEAAIAKTARPSFVERFEKLLNSTTSNWIFNNQLQNQNTFLFSHRKIVTTDVFVLYKELTPSGKDIRVQQVNLAKTLHFPESHWSPIHYVMSFQLQLELAGVDLIPGDGEHALLDVLLMLDKIYDQVRRLSMALWKIVIVSGASLIRDGSQTYITIEDCTVTCPKDEHPKVEVTKFCINILNVKKLSYKDIILPPLHMFHESIQLMPTGLDFLRKFLRAPKSYLRT